jgi:thiol-disulfide isomerase/thioredoxin
MTKKINIFLQILFLTILISCNSVKKETTTYFGGKIINPKTNHVILYSMDKVIDTFLLNTRNKFIGKVNIVNEGLYYFIHGDENQHIYLEPEDSLMLRLNTWDFDESLVFAGKGAERNNILVDCFLENEKERKLFYKFNKSESNVFKAKVDSLMLLKLETYNDYVINHPEETSDFNEILKITLTYPTFARIEKYPMIYAKYSENGSFPTMDSSFYNYRNDIQINKGHLMYYPPYSQYIRNYLYNETYALGHAPMKSEYSSKFTLDLMHRIDEKITSKKSKNAFLKQTVISHFYNKSSCNINYEAFDAFFKLSTNDKDLELIKNLVSDSKAVVMSEKLPDFKITDYTNAKHSISEIIKYKNAFLFFWSPEFVSENYMASRFKYLAKTYPNIKFIEIKIDRGKNDGIKNLDIKTQFYLDEKSNAHHFLSSKMPRSILIDRNGKVVNGFASISSYNLNPFLKKLDKQ